MPRVKFAKDYDWPIPGKRAMIAFKAGWSGLVTSPQARDAARAGALVEVDTKGKAKRK